jgi:hypothetical protein
MPHVETVRLVAAALDNPDYGVNAQLAVYDRAPNDDIPPDIKFVLNEFDHPDAARDTTHPEWPVLVVSADGPARSDGEPGLDGHHRDSDVPITIRYITMTAEPQVKRRDTFYTLNCIIRCLDALTNPATPQAHRELNTIAIQSKGECIYGATPVRPEDATGALLAGAIVVIFNVRDIF